jgi:hypothetical protein
MRLNVRQIINSSSAITYDLGIRVRETYADRWKHEPIVLDFTGVRNVSPSFLSQAIAPIIRNVPADELTNHVQFEAVPQVFELAWKKVLDAARAKAS